MRIKNRREEETYSNKKEKTKKKIWVTDFTFTLENPNFSSRIIGQTQVRPGSCSPKKCSNPQTNEFRISLEIHQWLSEENNMLATSTVTPKKLASRNCVNILFDSPIDK